MIEEKALKECKSKIAGTGLCSTENFSVGEHVEYITGKEVQFESKDENEASSIPTWYGITDKLWIDPGDTKFRFLNHSCEPNLAIIGKNELVARKKINKGDEVTIDYSMTDADEKWTLDHVCCCGSNKCRKTIRSIQSLLPETVREHLPFIPQFFLDVYKKAHPDVKL